MNLVSQKMFLDLFIYLFFNSSIANQYLGMQWDWCNGLIRPMDPLPPQVLKRACRSPNRVFPSWGPLNTLSNFIHIQTSTFRSHLFSLVSISFTLQKGAFQFHSETPPPGASAICTLKFVLAVGQRVPNFITVIGGFCPSNRCGVALLVPPGRGWESWTCNVNQLVDNKVCSPVFYETMSCPFRIVTTKVVLTSQNIYRPACLYLIHITW